MIVSREESIQRRRPNIERLEKRCMLSADFLGLDLDFDRRRVTEHQQRDNDFGDHWSDDRRDQHRHRDSRDDREDGRRFERQARREQQPREDHSVLIREFNDNSFIVVEQRPASTIAVLTQPITLVAPLHTLIVSIVSVPMIDIAPAVQNTVDVFTESTGGADRSPRPQRDTPPAERNTDTVKQDTENVINGKVVVARAADIDSTKNNGKTLVSTAPADGNFDRIARVSQTQLWAFDFLDSSSARLADVDESEIGRWLNRANSLTDQYSALEQTLDQLAKERFRLSMEPTSVDSISAKHQLPHFDSWLHPTDGILLLPAGMSDQNNAVDEIQPADLIAEGWTVGIGFDRALEIAHSDSKLEPLFAAIGQSADTGAIVVSSDDTRRDELMDPGATDSTNQILGVAICVVGIHYLRVRNQARRELML